MIVKSFEILAINPKQIDSSAVVTVDPFFCDHPADNAGDIIDFDVIEGDIVALFHLLSGPVQVTVDDLTTAPGIHVDCLTFGLIQSLLPVLGGKSELGRQVNRYC